MSLSRVLEEVEKQIQCPNIEQFFVVIDMLSELDTKYYAKYPDLRNVCLAKIFAFRNYPGIEPYMDSFEVLRLTLKQSLLEPEWVSNCRDTLFREAVENDALVYIDSYDTQSDCETFVDSVLDSE